MASLRSPRPRRARLLSAVLALALAPACARESRFVAAEPNADAEVRVILATASTGARAAVALVRDEPWSFALKEVFAADGASFRVYVYAYTLAQLVAEYPALEGRTLAEVTALLSPATGDPAPGAYAAPEPLRVLTAVVTPDSGGDVEYEAVSPSAARADPSGRLVFRLPAAVACAPGERPFRVFNRVEPARVCVYTRTASCEWAPVGGGCDALTTILEGSTDGMGEQLREVPPETLTDGAGITCIASDAPQRGESRTWLCPSASGATFVGVQDTPLARDGAAWIPAVGARPTLARDGHLVRGPRGAIFASDAAGEELQLSRIQASEDLQVDRLVFQSRNSLPPIAVTRASIGALRRLSANAAESTDEDQVVLDGDRGTAVLRGDHGVNASYNALAIYHPPVMLGEEVLPLARRRGDVISGALDNLYALVDTGVLVLRATVTAVTKVNETPAGQVSFDGTTPLSFAAVKRGAAERAVAWAEDGRVWVFDAQGALIVSDCQLEGTLLTVIDGPRVVRRPPGERFVLELVDLGPAESGTTRCTEARLATRYPIPASDQGATGAVAVAASGFLGDSGREALLYTYSDLAGVLDLGSGLSTAVELPVAAPSRSALFEEVAGGRLHAVLGGVDDARYQAISLGELDPRAR